jgi:Glycosyl transferase family 2
MIHAKSITKIEKVFFHHRVGRVGQTTSNLLQKDSGDENALSLEKIRTISKGAKLGGILPNFHHIGHYLFAESNSLSVERSWQDLKTASHIARLYFGKLKGQAPVLISKQYSVAMQSKFARRLAQISNYWFQNANATYVKEVEPRLRMFGHKFQNLDLSIIIPTFNDGSEICELLDNLYAHLPDPGFSFEVFVVDDGSTDNATINSLLDFAAKQKSNFYFLSSPTTFGAGRARNMAIPLVEGQYVYFAEATDDYNFGTLRNAVKHVQQNNIDLLVLSYFVEQLNSDKSTTRVAMMHQDANIWTEIEKTGNNMTQAEKRNAALALLNYPWKQITRSDVMFNANAYFGPTIVHNDAQFHWTSIWASQNIAFYPRKEKVCTHKKVDQSLSGVRSKKRTGMDVFPAIHSTQRALSLLGAFEPSTEEESVVGKRKASSEVFDLWKQFSRSLLSIYSKQVPPELLSKFSSKENMLLDGLDSVSTISHMDPLPYWVVENVLGNNHSDEDNAPS